MPNPHAAGKLILSKALNSQGIKVCLTGEGSDELFAGYPYFKLEALWDLQRRGEHKRYKKLWRQFCAIEARSEGMAWNRSHTLREKRVLYAAFADFIPRKMHGEHKHPFLSPPWISMAKTAKGRALFGDHLTSAAIANAGVYRPEFVAKVQRLWRWLPDFSALKRKLDPLRGLEQTQSTPKSWAPTRAPSRSALPASSGASQSHGRSNSEFPRSNARMSSSPENGS